MRLHPTAALFVTALAPPVLALGVGAPQGSAWIGQPLDLRVPLMLHGQAAGGSLCTQVELRQGDAARPEGGVQFSLEAGVDTDRPNLRVRSRRPVEEPLIHLRVKVGCQGARPYDFVLLADQPPAMPAGRAGPAAPMQAPGVVPAALERPVAPAARGPGAPAAAASARVQAAARSASPPAQRKSSAAHAPVARERLPLDTQAPGTLSWRPAREAAGLSASEVAPAPAASAAPGGRPALGGVERTTPSEAAPAERRAQASRGPQAPAGLRDELGAARDGLYPPPREVLWGLLLLLAAIALWALWPAPQRMPLALRAAEARPQARIRRGLRKRRAAGPPETGDDAQDKEAGDALLYFPAAVSRREWLAGDSEEEGERFGTPADSGAPTGTDGGPSARGSGPQPATDHALDVDELYDVQQQAEFFSSLGQHEQAVEVLRHYVDQHPQASAVAYLELLHLYHQLRREAEYEALRQQCQQALNVRVPAFRHFGAVGGRTLEHYPAVRARLQAHWPHPQTLDIIEELLFRRDDAHEAFELAAYRELLMLYGLLQEQRPGEGRRWPSLDELLRLPRLEAPAPAAAPVAARPVAGAGAPLPHRLSQRLDAQHHLDFQSPWPPAMGLDLALDMDLTRMEARQIDTIPLSLRRAAPAPDGSAGAEGVADVNGMDGRSGGATADARRSKQARVGALAP
ncbi:FimV family protein [Xenophilus sp. Marseille-Q4582]|uniref:type IV pilus assembly protein FimV n=1 Tax=Xenophilus sp. Marseille-Q4582 TaxID=2866600 RepID=UPI001CE49936|nr:hypothetical protein [Xenophilus sp. Marseille-Q4582]